jgi:NAD(P)-dependent dehydrogenase (short-subunit alcohol dehydrogenase family)
MPRYDVAAISGGLVSSHSNENALALVTGTSSGIGAALAPALLERGWTVIGLARRAADFGHPAYRHIVLDLADLDALGKTAGRELEPLLAEGRRSRVALVNNAALSGQSRGLEYTEPESLRELMAVNTVAPIFLMGFVTRVTPPSVPLRIVNISSGAAVRAFPGLGDYCASKAALRMAGMALAEELVSDQRPGGRREDAAVLSYEPGVVDTPMQTAARSHSAEEFPWVQPFKEFAAQGMLAPPEAVIGEIVDFVEGDGAETFVERRFAG